MATIKNYTNSVQHNVIATAIDKLNETNGLTYLKKDKIGTGENPIVDNPEYQLSTLNAMSEILNEIHSLGYKIVKNK